MLTVTKPSETRIDIELSGAVDAETMRVALEDLITKSEDVTDGRVLYTITDFSMPSLGAIGVELQLLPKLFGLLGKFKRWAVISDASWLRTAAEIEGALIPGIEIKSFELDQTDEAEAWLASN